MKRILASAAALAILAGSAAFAEMHEVQMLNVGSNGERMVFEPAFLEIAPGDTVRFLATDRGHNAASMDGMIPDGAEAFDGRINEEIEVTFDVEGLYGIQCTPHLAMGMVMTIAVGEVEAAPEDFLEGRIPPRARERFEAQLGNL
jgi:pseudoazurin